MKNLVFATIILLAATIVGCKKREDKCENASITGKVMHHALMIPNATVYIKHNTKEAPADLRNPKAYDDSVKGGADAVYRFASKPKGDYYLYAIGYDDKIEKPVYGGIPITIECKETAETINSNVPVVE